MIFYLPHVLNFNIEFLLLPLILVPFLDICQLGMHVWQLLEVVREVSCHNSCFRYVRYNRWRSHRVVDCLHLLLGSNMSKHLIWAIVAIHCISQIHMHIPRLENVCHILLLHSYLELVDLDQIFCHNFSINSLIGVKHSCLLTLVRALKSPNSIMSSIVENLISWYNCRYGDSPRVVNLE